MARKKPEVIIQRPSYKQRVERILRWIREDGGLILDCGCFVGVKIKDLDRISSLSGPKTVLDVIKNIEQEHENCPKM